MVSCSRERISQVFVKNYGKTIWTRSLALTKTRNSPWNFMLNKSLRHMLFGCSDRIPTQTVEDCVVLSEKLSVVDCWGSDNWIPQIHKEADWCRWMNRLNWSWFWKLVLQTIRWTFEILVWFQTKCSNRLITMKAACEKCFFRFGRWNLCLLIPELAYNYMKKL